MRKIFNFIIITIISFFGIGFIPYISGIFAILVSALIIFLPYSEQEYFILACAILLIVLYIPSNIIFNNKENNKENKKENINILPKVIGTFLVLSSPVIVYTLPWIITGIFVFAVLSHSRTGFDRFLNQRIKNWSAFIKDVSSGIATGIVLHTLYAGWLISPYVSAFLGK